VRFHEFEELEEYQPGGHEGVVNRLLVGEGSGGEGRVSVWHGRLLPGGHSEAHTHPSSLQVYVGISGEVVVGDDQREETLTPLATVLFPQGTVHFIQNRGNDEAEVLVISIPGLR
jgi:quercetin dioxygenase-like cupin family protein